MRFRVKRVEMRFYKTQFRGMYNFLFRSPVCRAVRRIPVQNVTPYLNLIIFFVTNGKFSYKKRNLNVRFIAKISSEKNLVFTSTVQYKYNLMKKAHIISHIK